VEGKTLKYLKALIQCASVPDPEVSAQIIEVLLDRKEISVRDITKELNVSYPLVLRVINDLTGLGIVTTSKLKIEGRGRPRKLVKLNVNKLLAMLDECRKSLDEVEKLIESKAKEVEGPQTVMQQS
jgi:predicted ArsR family transcriptional regulator